MAGRGVWAALALALLLCVAQPGLAGGACCHFDMEGMRGTCTTVASSAACDTLFGSYSGDDTSCSDTDPAQCPFVAGLCCIVADPCDCFQSNLASCSDETEPKNWRPQPTSCIAIDCEVPEPLGACCVRFLPDFNIFHPGTGCSVVTEATCDSFSGVYQGNNSPCFPVDGQLNC